ncbi:MAG: hypothetical protein Q8P20_10400 [bacterium]|nr:hypothetical protein [bacterium]
MLYLVLWHIIGSPGNIKTFLVLGILVTLFLYQTEPFHQLLRQLGTLGFIGAFIAGMLFVSIFTVSTGVLILLILAERLPLIPLGIIGGLGAVIGDLLIFKFVRDGLIGEIKLVEENIKDELKSIEFIDDHMNSRPAKHFRKHMLALLHTKYFSWILPATGVLILTSPLPDEMGMGLMGISKIKTYQLLLLLLIIKPASVFLVVLSSFVVKP